MGDFGIFTKSEQCLRELLLKITETEKPPIVTPDRTGQSTLYFSFWSRDSGNNKFLKLNNAENSYVMRLKFIVFEESNLTVEIWSIRSTEKVRFVLYM